MTMIHSIVMLTPLVVGLASAASRQHRDGQLASKVYSTLEASEVKQ